MSATQTKNLDNYNCSQIESLSSDYGLQHPLHYYEESSHRKKKSKQHHEPIPKKQILAHKKPIQKDTHKSTTISAAPRAITPPPHTMNGALAPLDTRPCLKPSKSVSSALNDSKAKHINHKRPPLTTNIAAMEHMHHLQNISQDNHSMNKNNTNSIGSVESLEYEPRSPKRKLLFDDHKDLEEDDAKEESITIGSIHTMDSDDEDHKEQHKKPKIRMWNAFGYGLEDAIEGQTFEWIDSKYVRLLQLSTYSTVMGPKVKFVWKNSEIYNDKCANEIQHDEDNKTQEHEKSSSYSNLRYRPEFAYHELEAWIAKQTLDCTGWKNRHHKNTPPAFTKKTMIAPEFGVVLTCIQFDSSLRALRNKQFNQYIHGIYAHHITNKTRKNSNDSHQTPNKSGSYSIKSYSSRYSSPVSSYRPVGDTLADYLSKCAPFSFSAGMSGGMNVSGANVPQVPFNYAMLNQQNPPNQEMLNKIQQHNAATQPYIDDNEDPDDIGHYSLVLAVEYKYNEKFIECLDGIEHWLYNIATQIRYLLALNKCFKCDQLDESIHESLHDTPQNEYNPMDLMDEDCPDRLHTIIPFMTNIVPTAIFKFDQLFSATFVARAIDNNNEDNYFPSRGLPQQISLFDTWFTSTLDNRDKHKLSTMISSHLQTLGRTVIVGDNEEEIDRYISTLALFSTSQQRSLSRLSVKVDNPYNLCTHYIPELFLQGIVIPSMENETDSDYYIAEGAAADNNYNATVAYLQSSSAIKQLQEDLYLAPGPSTLILLTSVTKHHEDHHEQQSFWWIRQSAMPHKYQLEQQGLLFQKLFYLKRRRRDNSTSSYIYARRRSGPLFDASPSHKENANHQRTKERKEEKQKEKELLKNMAYVSKEFKSINNVYQTAKAVEEEEEEEHSTNTISSTVPQPIHAPHSLYADHNNLTFVEPSLSPMIATIVFGSFNIPQQLKMTFLETQFRILLQKASEILLYIEHEQRELLSFYDKTCHVMSCKDFKEQVPMEALYPQIMQKFESQLRSDLQIARQEDLYVLLSISEGFRPNLFSLMFGNPVFDIEVADILRYFLF